ncbi:hypothetical protein PENTCL1PPCAC_9741, partial [Pristionchus entomophagus]
GSTAALSLMQTRSPNSIPIENEIRSIIALSPKSFSSIIFTHSQDLTMNKTEPSNSVLSLILYGVVAAFGVALNFIVLIAFVKGRLALKPYSSIYILALQSIIVDVIFVAIHLIYWIPKAINPDFLGERGSYTDSVILRVADSVGTYAWFHNALSHAIIAANRFIVIIYYQRNILTRQRVIAMAVVHHILALTITLLTQFAIPCCRLSFNFSIFSYFNVPNGDMPNYSDIFFTVPVNTIGSVTSLICYSTEKIDDLKKFWKQILVALLTSK